MNQTGLKSLVIVGAGGFGREVAWLVQEINEQKPEWNFFGFVDDYSTGQTVEGYPILGNMEWLLAQPLKPYVVCAVGDPRIRRKLVKPLSNAGFPFATLIHPSVKMSKYVQIGKGSMICAGVIITTNIVIGEHCLLNLGCFVGHDTTVGDYASMMPGTNIAGDVEIGEGSYYGLNSCVINQVKVGEWSIIGAGATVTKDIPPYSLAVGVPAKPIRTISI